MLEENTKKIISRDEMNLAEFPLTVLSTRANPNLKTLEFKDTIRSKNGELTERHWIITGADKFGLPTASDDEVLLGLLKLTVEDGMKDRRVYFTRYELLRALRWSTEGRSSSRLQKALDRLAGVKIKASNAFFDNDSKCHSTRVFGLIDAYEINSARDGDLKSSYFTWSETLYKSFQVGFIKKLDLDYYLSLKSAISKRLYRYLDKHFWYKSKIEINLFTLAHEKIGISRNYQYASSLRQQMDPALEELISTGFISECSFSGKGKDTTLTIIAKRGCRSDDAGKNSSLKASRPPEGHRQNNNTPLQLETMSQLISRGLSEKHVLQFIEGKSEEVLQRIQAIVTYFDSLLAKNSPLVSRSPVGFLYRAVENPEKFKLPSSKPTALKATVTKSQAPVKESESLDQIVRQEVELALRKIKPHLSQRHYEMAFEHAVKDRLQKLQADRATER
jgi:hypothetical protein